MEMKKNVVGLKRPYTFLRWWKLRLFAIPFAWKNLVRVKRPLLY